LVDIGEAVIFRDSRGRAHNALVTEVHGQYPIPKDAPEPAINLVYVSSDNTQRDPYGNQIIRESSVVHKSFQSAHGNFWE